MGLIPELKNGNNMKETQFTPQDEIRQEIPAQHQKKPQFLSSKSLKKNQFLFEFNFREDTIKKVVFEDPTVCYIGEKPKKKVVIKQNCLYIPALNFKNAIRHIKNKISLEYNPKIIE